MACAATLSDVGQRDHRSLRHAVVGHLGQRKQPRRRSHVQDVATLLPDQHRYERVAAMDHAPEIDVDDPVPLLERDLVELGRVHDAGIVHEDVDGAPLFLDAPPCGR
jgi:hypothetical protein